MDCSNAQHFDINSIAPQVRSGSARSAPSGLARSWAHAHDQPPRAVVDRCQGAIQFSSPPPVSLYRKKEKKKNRYIFFSHPPRAEQMPDPPWEGQLMCTLFLSARQ